ncbi:MAG: PRC-barrel domain-containing protein [Candidatus Thermoplasmatota archaeon]
MQKLKELEGKKVLTGDGKLAGEVNDFTYRVNNIERIVIKMNKDILEDIGEDKPLLSSVKRGLAIGEIKAFSDNVILHEDLDDLHLDFEEVSEEDLVSSLRGMKINDSGGRDVGKVTDILIDIENWSPPSLLVKLNKDILETLDVEGSLLSKTELAISMTHVDEISDWIILDKSADQMGEIIEKEPVKKV